MQTLRETKAKSTRRVKVVVIDPFQQGTIALSVDPANLEALHQLLDCQLMLSKAMSPSVTLWLDECAAYREPAVYPAFYITDADGQRYGCTGYGLLTGRLDQKNQITGIIFPPGALEMLNSLLEFESWTERLDPYLYLDQLFRLYPTGAK